MSGKKITVEIEGRDKFWENALRVEWEHEYPDRQLEFESPQRCLIDPAWFDDLTQVGARVFCRITRAPDNPARRQLFGSLFPWRRDD